MILGKFFNLLKRHRSVQKSVSKFINYKVQLDLRSTMSSPRTGILSLIRFSSGQDRSSRSYGWLAHVILESPPVPIGLGF